MNADWPVLIDRGSTPMHLVCGRCHRMSSDHGSRAGWSDIPAHLQLPPDPPCEPIEMIIGEHVQYAATVAPAKWIKGACGGAPGTVGSLVPNQYPLVMRVGAPDPGIDDWWSAYCDLFAVTASIGQRHTSSPDRAWLAVWEGHGFANSSTRIAWNEPFDDPGSAFGVTWRISEPPFGPALLCVTPSPVTKANSTTDSAREGLREGDPKVGLSDRARTIQAMRTIINQARSPRCQ